MTSTESQQPIRDDFVRWGTAPEDRQCRYTFASGYHCRRWSVRGHQYCQEHGRWMECRVDGPIEVPLMEDPQAVQLVATQTVRAVSWGHIPPANGRAILHGCRVVQTGFAQDLALAKFLLKCHTLGVDANQFLPARFAPHFIPQETKPEAQQTRVPHVSPPLGDMEERDSAPAVPDNEPQATQDLSAAEEAGPALYPLSPVPSLHPLDDLPPAPRPKSVCEPCVDALKEGADESLVDCDHCPAHRSSNLRAPQLPDPPNPPEPAYDSRTAPSPEQPAFRDLKKNWDRDLRRAARHRLRPDEPRRGQTCEEILAARARPFDDYLRAPRTSPPPPIPNRDAH